jgi:type I restriction enzyme M protein
VSIVQDKALSEATSQWVAALDVLRSEMPVGESRSFIREVFVAFLLLRWADLQDAEQEAMAVFEDRTYQPLLPEPLQWRHWTELATPQEMKDRLRQLEHGIRGVRSHVDHPFSAYLAVLAEPLQRILKVNFFYLYDFVRWVGELPFETEGERRELLDTFDHLLSETREPQDGVFASPQSVSRLMAALGNPRAGERVYDPCFGSGGFLVEAWRQVQRTRGDGHRAAPGQLLEISGVERNADAFLIGLTRMLLAGIDAPRLVMGDALERDPVSSPSREGFDLVLADPPWGARDNSRHGRESWGYGQYAYSTNDYAGLFVQHALAQLKAQGRAVVAVPEGFLYRGGVERDLRRSLVEAGQIEAVVSLPAGTYAPSTQLRSCLVVLSKQGGASTVRMVDASPFFETRSGSKAPHLRVEVARQLANEVMRPELRPARALPSGAHEGTPGTGRHTRAIWEVGVDELAASDWDLTPRRREEGGLEDLLLGLQEALSEATMRRLDQVVEVTAGRSIKAAFLRDEPDSTRAVGYLRIRDLSQGRISRPTSWLVPDLAATERRWALAPGDVLLSRSGTIGKVAVVRNGAIGSIAANGLYVLRADPVHVDPGFLVAYLASPATQNWLTAKARGSVIQHLNRPVLDALPIVLPPLGLQARAAAHYRDSGGDVFAFLARASGSGDEDRLGTWLAELSKRIPSFSEGLDATPALALLEPLVSLANVVYSWTREELFEAPSKRWVLPLSQALVDVEGLAQVPLGPSLLTLLQEAERGFAKAQEAASGHLPIESQARFVAEMLSRWMRSAIDDLVSASRLDVRTSVGELHAGTLAEFSVDVINVGHLPLRSVRVESSPDWGITEATFLAENTAIPLHLRGDVAKQPGTLALQLRWSARNLNGDEIKGSIELTLPVVDAQRTEGPAAVELGANPYVMGSPLEPRHGHLVFFGRTDLIEQIGRQVSTHGNVILLEGNRRAGKTSILKHLEGRTAIPGWLAVYASLQGAEGAEGVAGVPTAEIFREMARSIATAVTVLDVDVRLPDGRVIAEGSKPLGVARACRDGISTDAPFADFREYLEYILSVLEPLGLGLLLMMDEFDKLQEGIDNGVTSPQVPENIRFLIQNYPKFSAILTGSRRLKRLREEHWSALYGLGTSISVSTLDPESARRIVTQPVRDLLTYSREATDRVVDLTASQPYLIQCLCNRVFEYAAKTKARSITLSVVNEVAADLVRDNEHFASLWDYAAKGPETGRLRRQLILLMCTQGFKRGSHVSFVTLHEQLAQAGIEIDDEALDTDMAYLRELELIDLIGEIGDGRYRLAIPMMGDWIEQQQDAEVVKSRARVEAEEEHA